MHSKRKFLSYPHAVYKKSEKESPEGHDLKTPEWAVYAQIDSRKSIEDISVILATDIQDITGRMRTLYFSRLVDVAEAKKLEARYISAAFFREMEQALTSIVGPVALYVIEDALAKNDLLKTSILKEKISELVELASDEIDDDDKKIKFQTIMLDYIKK